MCQLMGVMSQYLPFLNDSICSLLGELIYIFFPSFTIKSPGTKIDSKTVEPPSLLAIKQEFQASQPVLLNASFRSWPLSAFKYHPGYFTDSKVTVDFSLQTPSITLNDVSSFHVSIFDFEKPWPPNTPMLPPLSSSCFMLC